MVDFSKLIKKGKGKDKTNPIDIFETLDRASDKGPLRPVQEELLSVWYQKYCSERDVIIKLHTGQGKTLIGLLILQSRINQGKGPVIYLCPDNYLVKQACQQAESFGIPYKTYEEEGKNEDTTEGSYIWITTVSKLFNGKTSFGLDQDSVHIGTLLIDDSHACIDIIKNAYKIILGKDLEPYKKIIDLFSNEIEKQGVGTFADIKNGQYNAFLPVPYWDWQDKESEVARILSNHEDLQEIKFAWPLIKDDLKDCFCVISGDRLEILPHYHSLDKFGSYHNAEHRIFMSATLIDDSFLIKGLGIDSKAILHPLTVKDEKWSGEKMILVPSLIDEEMDREYIVEKFGSMKNKTGKVVLSPSFNKCLDWKGYGSTIAEKDTLREEISKLKNREENYPLVIVNRYDGIDLPDHTCRILIFDSKPFAQSLIDNYIEKSRKNSKFTQKKIAQIIEQGIGRGVRGEKDYCAILFIGSSLIKLIRSKATQQYFSPQTRKQIEIGLAVTDFANQELQNGETGYDILKKLLKQLISRDEGWKTYYAENMDKAEHPSMEKQFLEILELERDANTAFYQRDYNEAKKNIQEIIDNYILDVEDIGWYLQEMARMIYPDSKVESNQLQTAAHKKNRNLLKPKSGVVVEKIPSIGTMRIENIKKWIVEFHNYEELNIQVESILSDVRFGVIADDFEEAFHRLGVSLGFKCERPDKNWKEGPDNLWHIKDGMFLLVEAKNEVALDRVEINKQETGQMNNSCAWFAEHYPGAKSKNLMIVPTKKLGKGAGFNKEVEIVRQKNLKLLIQNISNFFKEFKSIDFKDISEQKINNFLTIHKLSEKDLISIYSEQPVI